MLTLDQKTATLSIIARMNSNEQRIDAMQVARVFNQCYIDNVDWHEFSFYLDELRTRKILTLDHSRKMLDKFTCYKLNK